MNDMFAAEDLEFLQAIADDLPINCTLEETCKSLSVILNVTRWKEKDGIE